MTNREQTAKTEMADEEAGFKLLDEWLRIETERADPGFLLPSRAAVVAWSEDHAVPVLLIAGLLLCAPVIGAICFG